MSFATDTFPTICRNDGSATGDLVNFSVESTGVITVAGGTLSIQASDSGGNVGCLASPSAITPVDGEVAVVMLAPTVTSGTTYSRGGPAQRFGISGGNNSGYFIRETTANDSSSWELVLLVDESPTKTVAVISAMAPAGLSSSYGTAGIGIRYKLVGSFHMVKIWDFSGAEPAWSDATHVFFKTEASKGLAGRIGICSGSGSSSKTNCDQVALYQFNAVQGFNSAPTATAANGGATNSVATTAGQGTNATPFSCALSCWAYEPLLIAILHSKATTPDSITAVTCDNVNLVISGRQAERKYSTVASPTMCLSIYTAMSPVDISGATLSVFTNNTTQSGDNISILRLNGADRSQSDGSGWIKHGAGADNDASSATSPSLTLAAFTNAIATSGTVAAVGHSGNTASTVEANWTLGHSLSYGTPAAGLGTEWRADNDTTPTMTFTAVAGSSVWAAEVQCAVTGVPLANPTDAVGITNTVGGTGTHARTLANTVGITNTVGRQGAHARTVTDTVGITDTVLTARNPTAALSDTVAITDTVGRQGAHARTVTDTVAITNTITGRLAFARTLSDTVGITDTVTRSLVQARTFTDTVAITDTVSGHLAFARGATDTVAITATVAARLALARTLTDVVGISDTLARRVALARTLTDTVGIAGIVTAGAAASPTDTVGIIGTASARLAFARGLTDTVAITDTVTTLAAHARTLANAVAIIDAISTIAARPRTAGDTVGITDVLTALAAHQRGAADTVGITDTVAARVALARTLADIVGITATLTTQIALARALTDIVAIIDTLSVATARGGIPNVVGITDTVTVLVALASVQAYVVRYREDLAGRYHEDLTGTYREDLAVRSREWA